MELVKSRNYYENKQSIYKIIKSCTNERKVDSEKCEKILNFSEDSCNISEKKFNLKSQEQKKKEKEQINEIMNVINRISIKVISAKEAENQLVSIKFITLNIIDQVIDRINQYNYNHGVYQTFKRILYITSDKEVMKLAIEMTGMLDSCSELFEDYLLIGQCSEFTRFISSVYCKWRDNRRCQHNMFKLLESITGMESVYYAQLLINIDDLMDDIYNQRRLLIALVKKNNCLSEIAIYAIDKINLLKLSKIAHNDIELSEAIVKIMYSLCFEENVYGDILCVEEPLKIIGEYLRCVKYSKFEQIKNIGISNIYVFLDNSSNRERFISLYDEISYNNIFEEIKFLYMNKN